MSTKIAKLWITGLLVNLAAVVALAEAPHHSPFIDPAAIQGDFQFFAPVDIDVYGTPRPGNTGWFGTYDRMHIWLSRPKNEASRTEGDFTWGNRYDIGYMTEDNEGWFASIMHIDGPLAFDISVVDRGETIQPDGGDNPVLFDPDLKLRNSENWANYSNVELNKVIRLRPLHKGGILEPFFGVRLSEYDHHDIQEVFTPSMGGANELLDTDLTNIKNMMIGGQLGIRGYRRTNRWILSGEVRMFGLQNFQSAVYTQSQISDVAGGIGTDSGTAVQMHTRIYDHEAEFVFGGEVRAEAAYEITRDVAVRFGAEIIHFGRGVGRGFGRNGIYTPSDEDVTAFGLTFGFVVNR